MKEQIQILTCLVLLLVSAVNCIAVPSKELKTKIRQAAKIAHLDPLLLESVIRMESNFKKNARSPKGAFGLMQVMPDTADECGIDNLKHVTNHLVGASRCLRKLINKYQGKKHLALAAYNAGPNAVKKYKGIPPYKETKDYVKKVLAHYEKLRANAN